MFAKLNKLFVMMMVVALVLSACAQPAAQPAATQQPVAQPPAAGDAKQLNIAVVVKAVTSDYWKLVGAGVEDAMKADPTIKATFLGPNEETELKARFASLRRRFRRRLTLSRLRQSGRSTATHIAEGG